MNPRGILKLLFVLISFLLSSFFIFFSSNLYIFEYPASIFYLFPIGVFVIFLEIGKRRKLKKFWKKIYVGVVAINIGMVVYYVYKVIEMYLKFRIIESNLAFYYSILMMILLISSFFDIKGESDKLNDFLTIITCIMITLVVYRYEVDPNFLHNLLKIKDPNNFVLQDSYHYVTQYYPSFIAVLLVLLIQKNILKMKK